MRFTYGEEYRIGFQHEKPRDWSAHAQHPICFSADGVLFCRECSTPISGIGPAAARVCKAAGREADRELDLLANGMNAGVLALLKKRAKAVRRAIARDLARDVTCTIYKRVAGEWEATAMVGRSRLNTDAGDQYNREDGRIAALRDALPKPNDGPARPEGVPPGYHSPEALRRKAFVNAAIDAYLNRARKGSGRTRKAGGK